MDRIARAQEDIRRILSDITGIEFTNYSGRLIPPYTLFLTTPRKLSSEEEERVKEAKYSRAFREYGIKIDAIVIYNGDEAVVKWRLIR